MCTYNYSKFYVTFYIFLIILYFEISNKIFKKIIIFESLSIFNSNSNREIIYFSLIFFYINIFIFFDFSLNSELVNFITLSLLILSSSLLFLIVNKRFSLFVFLLFILILFIFSNKLINILLII